MKKQFLTMIKGTLITGLTLSMILPAWAQKQTPIITRDQVRKITEIVKPLKDQFEKQLTGDDRYQAYVKDLQAVHAARNIKEKSSLTGKLEEKYSAFFREIWEGANVDERSYQQRIRSVFPENIANLLQFDAFLNFSLLVSAMNKLAPKPPAPEKCVDICQIAKGEISGTSALIGSGGGSYGMCYLRTNAWTTGAFLGGSSELTGWLRNNVSVPGTFPHDTRKLQVKKSFELRQEATAFAALGSGYSQTWVNTYRTTEHLVVCAPFIWGMHQVRNKTISENYPLEKNNLLGSKFWSYSSTFSVLGSGNWSFSDCSDIKWTMCEEK